MAKIFNKNVGTDSISLEKYSVEESQCQGKFTIVIASYNESVLEQTYLYFYFKAFNRALFSQFLKIVPTCLAK